MNRTIRIRRFLPHAPDKVWTALTDRAQLSAWLMPTSDFQLQLGHRFLFQMPPQRGWDGQTFCQLTEIDAPRALAYTWCGRATGAKPLRCAGMDSAQLQAALEGVEFGLNSTVRFTLTPQGNGTRMELTHAGFSGRMILVSFILEMGWRTRVLARLETLLAG